MAVCRKVTIHVEEDALAPQYYVVTTYLQGDRGVVPGCGIYRKLTWTEACDVILVCFDENRPGQDVKVQEVQEKLW